MHAKIKYHLFFDEKWRNDSVDCCPFKQLDLNFFYSTRYLSGSGYQKRRRRRAALFRTRLSRSTKPLSYTLTFLHVLVNKAIEQLAWIERKKETALCASSLTLPQLHYKSTVFRDWIRDGFLRVPSIGYSLLCRCVAGLNRGCGRKAKSAKDAYNTSSPFSARNGNCENWSRFSDRQPLFCAHIRTQPQILVIFFAAVIGLQYISMCSK